MSIGNYSITTRASGLVLTAAIYNADHQNHVTNQNPTGTGAYSDTTVQMKLQTDPGGVGSESLPSSLAGELERIRFVIANILNTTIWYDYANTKVPKLNAANTWTSTQQFNAAVTIGSTLNVTQATTLVGTTINGVLAQNGTLTMGAGALNQSEVAAIALNGGTGQVVPIGAITGNSVALTTTGGGTITGFDSVQAGAVRYVMFNVAVTLVNSGALSLGVGGNILTANGDIATFLSRGGANWWMVNFRH